MRYTVRSRLKVAECDMTPMIDMTFQLIAFFMVLISFNDVQQNERIHLPSSELAKPPESPPENPVTLQLTKEGKVLFLGELVEVKRGLTPLLRREYEVFNAKKAGSGKQATVIIRADRETKTGVVQEVIKVCQDIGFERFALRAKQQTHAVTLKKT
jgi:biopolymer transport protein ExbD